MISAYFKKIIWVCVCAAVSALFIVLAFFFLPEIKSVPLTSSGTIIEYDRLPDGTNKKTEYTAEKDFNAYCIEDLTELGKLTSVNYVPNRFEHPGHLSDGMIKVDLTKPFDFAEQGTLFFVIMSIDPEDTQFNEKAEKLAPYKIGNYWNFTVSLPKIFGAANVYCNSNLIARNGEIKDYNFSEFNDNYDVTTKEHVTSVAFTEVPLKFYTKHIAVNNQIVTVHYQSGGGAYSGISEFPLIGTESAVSRVRTASNTTLIIAAILAVTVLAVLVVMSALERSKKFTPAIVWIFGIVALLLSRFFAMSETGIPLFWSAVALASPFVILVGALMYMTRRIGKFPAQHVFPAIAAVGALLSFICPFVSFNASAALKIACIVVRALSATALTSMIVLSLVKKNGAQDVLQISCATIIDVTIIASLFLPQIYPSYVNPIFYLCIATMAFTFVTLFILFGKMKKSNAYLTANLHKEVERQVKDIKDVITERDNLLQFVSHDMKKPLTSAVNLLDTAIEREKDGEQIKTLEIVRQNGMRVINNLSEIAIYAKFNYIAEPSQVVDLCEMCTLIYKYHKLDCDANGIILKNTVDSNINAFVKKQGLENVISNIIINAVEHADCSVITISAKPEKDRVVLMIADNGKGVDADMDVFKPYISENNTEAGGVGLYICKSIMESMNGELSYTSSVGDTVFRISLPKA